jgi:hypothetical protein
MVHAVHLTESILKYAFLFAVLCFCLCWVVVSVCYLMFFFVSPEKRRIMTDIIKYGKRGEYNGDDFVVSSMIWGIKLHRLAIRIWKYAFVIAIALLILIFIDVLAVK